VPAPWRAYVGYVQQPSKNPDAPGLNTDHGIGKGNEMKRYRLWFKQGITRVEDLGVWEGEDKRDAATKCLAQRNQTIAHCADLLGLSEDRYLIDYVEAEELNGSGQTTRPAPDDARQHARVGGAPSDRLLV
jgi:hypothetical protein